MLTLGLHVGVAGWVSEYVPVRERPPRPVVAELVLETFVEAMPAPAAVEEFESPPSELEPPSLEPMPPEPANVTPSRARSRAPSSAPPAAEDPPLPSPAQAGQVLAAAEPSFAGFDMTVGHASRYVGGVTASLGQSTSAVFGPTSAAGSPNAARGGRGAGGRGGSGPKASSGGLADSVWSCPWPAAAISLKIEEQVVMIRVIVEADGRIARAELLSDPGHGFGDAAVRCALESRGVAPVDEAGVSYAATLPPIKVTFTR